MVVSSSRIDKKPKQSVTASGTIILVCASIRIDNKSAMVDYNNKCNTKKIDNM